MRHKFAAQEADDFVQEVFAVALKRIDAGDPRDAAKLANYMWGICRHVVHQGIRERIRHQVLDFDFSILRDLMDRADVRLMKERDALAVQTVLARLRPKYREIIICEYFLELDREDARKKLKLGLNGYRITLFRALKRFRIEWDIYMKSLGDKI
jgi:RNA polymerase sigma factor (sigma-70 family)